jgi:hypothetical protein
MGRKKFPEPMETYNAAEAAVFKMVQRGQLDKAIAAAEKKLSKLPESDYHQVLGRSWSDQAEKAAKWLQKLARKVATKFPVSAIYCEMNRFEINTDEWYLDAFAYDRLGDPDDLGWLSGWQESTEERSRFVLKGMSDLQAAFQRDYLHDDGPNPEIIAPSELAILLLTLRMQELVDLAAHVAWKEEWLSQETLVLSAAHDTGMVCISKTSAGEKQLREARQIARKTPPPSEVREDGATGPGVYLMDGGWDNGNSLPWHVLDHEGDMRDLDPVSRKTEPLSGKWNSPNAKLRKRKWPGDLISMYPAWTVNCRARDVIEELVRDEVEFLPIECDPPMERWLIHPLVQIPLAKDAVTSRDRPFFSPDSNITTIYEYSFSPADLVGRHLFRISQHPDSPAGRARSTCTGWFVSDEFVRAIEENKLNGVMFKKVVALR